MAADTLDKDKAVDGFFNKLKMNQRFILLDLALLTTAILLMVTGARIIFFHTIFVLLTFGAFYWSFRAFVWRACLWVTVTSVVLAITAMTGELPVDELLEIPMMVLILLLVFVIASYRSRAEAAEMRHREALRQANEELERRVLERTAELTRVNAALVHEITQHKQTAETLRESEERYRRLVELGFQAIVIHSQGTLIYVNSPATDLVDAARPEELIGKSLDEFIHPDDWPLVQERFRQVREDGKGVPLSEIRLVRLDGSSVDVEVMSVPITYQGQPAVHSVIRDISARKQVETERAQERSRIARDLHDSLGHSLAYLHLKLDELSQEAAVAHLDKVQQSLGQMCTVANQAYEVVRGMLAALRPVNSTNLATALLIQARAVGKRANFKVHLTSTGQPRPLSPVVQQQLLYILQEGLANVEKHAYARQVEINLAWTKTALTIILSDDGCGFPVDMPALDGHFGLAIMQERAQEIEGYLTLSPSPTKGTQLILYLPLTPKEGMTELP